MKNKLKKLIKQKILIGVLVVGIILIGRHWILSKRASESGSSEEIYKKGETIKFKIDDTVQICRNELPYRIVRHDIKKPDIMTIKLQHSCIGEVGSGFDQYCEFGKIVSKEISTLCDFSKKWCHGCSDALTCWNESIHETFTWNQKEYVETTEECEGKTIRRELKKQVPEGKYQIITNGKVIKEFIIK